MFAIRPRIFHKGLILLSVPLLFELAVAGSLIYLQHYYGEAVKAEALRKQILYRINELWFYSIEMTTTNLSGTFLGRVALGERSNSHAYGEYKILKDLVEQTPKQQVQLDNIKLSHDRSYNACGSLKPYLSATGGTLGQILALKANLTTCKKLTEADIETGNLIRAFREHELYESARASEKVKGLAWLIQVVLLAAIVGSLVLAAILFHYFMQGIHKGVQTLTLNIQRFTTGEALAPVIAGTDELAVLDHRFHEMADEVAEAQKMKQAFLTTVSRELGIPIRAAKDYLTQLCKGSFGDLPEEAAVHARKAEKTLERLIGLMNDLLALQGRGAAKMEIHPRTCDVDEALQSSMDSVSAFADRAGVRLERTDTKLQAYADPDRIVQVIVNLLSNAIKFSNKGSAVVLTATPINEQVEIRVKDSGRGIPAHLRGSVFEKFEQVSSTDATEKGGTGLGLPICKEIIENHGGTIGVISEEGKGSTFWFRLPTTPPAQE